MSEEAIRKTRDTVAFIELLIPEIMAHAQEMGRLCGKRILLGGLTHTSLYRAALVVKEMRRGAGDVFSKREDWDVEWDAAGDDDYDGGLDGWDGPDAGAATSAWKPSDKLACEMINFTTSATAFVRDKSHSTAAIRAISFQIGVEIAKHLDGVSLEAAKAFVREMCAATEMMTSLLRRDEEMMSRVNLTQSPCGYHGTLLDRLSWP